MDLLSIFQVAVSKVIKQRRAYLLWISQTRSSSNSSSSSDESESDTLNSSLANLPLCELQTTISTHKEPLAKPSTISPQKPLVQSKTDSEQFSSPVITKRMEYPVKRDSSDQSDNPPPLTKKKNSILSPNSAFRKSLQCVTPIKDKKMKKSYKPTQQQSGTPPHFWSLDMPPTP